MGDTSNAATSELRLIDQGGTNETGSPVTVPAPFPKDAEGGAADSTEVALLDDDVPRGLEKRELTWWRLALITFVYTCSGPGGLEQVVLAGGPIIALAGVFFVPIFFVVPQIFVVSEMGGMMPTSAGNVVWVQRAFGRFAGFYNAWVFALTNAVDLAVYPVLFGDYVGRAFIGTNVSWSETMVFRIVGLGIGMALALLSSKDISNVTGIGCVLTAGFFIVVFFAATPHLDPPAQFNYVEQPIDYGLLSSSLLWLFTGWVSLGALAGEVTDGMVLVKGMSSALGIDVVMYLVALLAAMTKAVRGEWTDGYFVTVYDRIIPGIGPVFGACIGFTSLTLFLAAIICYTRTVWGMAEMGWAPKILQRQLPTGAPVVAVAVHAVTTFGMIWFDFGFIVQVEYTVAAASYILTAAAFLRLRYTEPEAHRPYVVPGGMPVAWLVTATKVIVMVATSVAGLSQDWRVGVAFVGTNIAVVLGYFAYDRAHPNTNSSEGVA
uniref:Amino acid permease/ SLC12A domain-containing protein n=1 Tax=Neobodo designis TaxID=312471 RepID=A0A7S1MJX0_NEODS|mmetsp:Transcript_41795/g.129120  ORF Transcript_41795/g.129120 Transcript_41795/m.129120 type:complete len:491 (+) Transcript_41795:34-1506(+)